MIEDNRESWGEPYKEYLEDYFNHRINITILSEFNSDSDLEDAAHSANSDKWDVILIDIQLNNYIDGGVTIIKNISDEQKEHTLVITAYHDVELYDKLINLGISDTHYFTRPGILRRLASKINKVASS